MDRASAFIVAVSAGCVSMDRGLGRNIAGPSTAIAWEHSGHLPEDVPLHVLVGQFLEWQYDGLRPAWARERGPSFAGTIYVGARFVWAAGDPKAEALIDVTRIDAQPGLPRSIWFRHADRRMLPEWERLDANARLVRQRFGAPCREDEFRAAVTPCLQEGGQS